MATRKQIAAWRHLAAQPGGFGWNRTTKEGGRRIRAIHNLEKLRTKKREKPDA